MLGIKVLFFFIVYFYEEIERFKIIFLEKNNFFIKVELLTEVERPVYFSSSLLAKCLYRREKSEQWQKIPLGATSAINVDILIKR
ncbi:hypothetical protein ACNFNZ_13530 [Empedobacter brevis]|uniref:hypothetical protein n=1 Tax=Empedobacter brevis TaxID=247 RepID=UPI0023EF5772|nr:hypothetical protein [Empedobacter brevis]